MPYVLRIDRRDNVAVALEPLEAGACATERGSGMKVVACQVIPFGHKIALSDIKPGEAIVKYGEVIGRATKHISTGCHVHIHNVESLRGRGDIA